MKKLLFIAAIGLTPMAKAADIALDNAAGTNIVTALGGTMTYAGSVVLPIVLAVMLIGAAVGLYRALAPKGKIRT